MLAKRVIACLDIDGGRVVKGRQFLDLRNAGDPVHLASVYCEEGADEIVVLDVSATNERRLASQTTINRIARSIDVPLCVGGGVRSLEDIAFLLDAGADKVAMNSAAVANPRVINDASRRFGSQCVVLSIDARRTRNRTKYEIATHGARVSEAQDPVTWAVCAQSLGAGEILLTSIDRDGTASGFDLDLIRAVSDAVTIPVVASGGARDAQSFVEAYEAGADAALAASLFHFGTTTVSRVKAECASAGIVVRR